MKSLNIEIISPLASALRALMGHVTLVRNAYDVQPGCVFYLEQRNKTMKPIWYWSKSFTEAKCRHDTARRKCIANKWAILLLRPHLEKSRFTSSTNRDYLKWILNLTHSTGRLARWRVWLSQYCFDVFNRARIENQEADALSSLQTTGEDRKPLEYDRTILAIDITENQENLRIIVANCEEMLPLNAELSPTDNTLLKDNRS